MPTRKYRRSKGGKKITSRRGRNGRKRARRRHGKAKGHSRRSLRKTKSAPKILMRQRFRKKRFEVPNASWAYVHKTLEQKQREARDSLRRKYKKYDAARKRDQAELDAYYKNLGSRWDEKSQKWVNV